MILLEFFLLSHSCPENSLVGGVGFVRLFSGLLGSFLSHYLFHHAGSIFYIPMLRIEAMGFKVYLAAQVDTSCGFSLLPQMQLDGVEQASANDLALPCGLDMLGKILNCS